MPTRAPGTTEPFFHSRVRGDIEGTMKWTTAIFLSVVSAGLLGSAFPASSFHYLSWVALVPVLLVVRRGSRFQATISSLLTGYLFYAMHLRWALELEDFNRYNYAVGLLGFSWYIGVFGFAAHYFQRKAPRWDVLTFPSLWAALEYLRSHIGFLSVSWGILGYSQHSVLPVARVSTLTGVYGVSFLIVAVNTFLSEIVLWYLEEPANRPVVSTRMRERHSLSLPAAILASVTVPVALSNAMTFFPGGNTLPDLRVGIVQGNIYAETGFLPINAEKVFGVYRRLTHDVAQDGPLDLIVWPSSSVPGTIPYEKTWVDRLSLTAQESGSFLLIGSSGFDKFNPEQRRMRRPANSAFLFSPKGEILGRYDKIRLLPFDEYLPLRGIVKWPSWIVSPGMKDHYAGKELTIFRTDRARFGVLICWENMFPDLFREMVSRGADLMVGMTNEGFTHSSTAHQQMLPMYVFRAVENNVSVIRTASTGISAIIAPNGEITTRVAGNDGKDVDIEGYAIGRVPLSSRRTFYTRYGDLFSYCLLVFLICFFMKILLRHKYLELGAIKEEDMKKGTAISCCFVFLFLIYVTDQSHAGDAEVLPKGVRSVYFENKNYIPVKKKFDDNGNVVDAAQDFNATLDSSVFSDLSFLETAFGLPPGSANIGTSVVSFEYNFNILNTYILYGVTDKLTVGAKVPYWWASNKVRARLDTTNATIGKNPLFGTPSDPTGGQAPLIPIGGLGSVPVPPLTTQDVQNLLGNGLDVNGDGAIDIPGFGFKPVEDWSDDGVGDIEVGFKYQYYNSSNWHLANTFAVRFPTGRVDDPDNLVDYPFGAAAAALLFYFHNDYVGVKDLVLDATFKYDLYLPHSQTVRVPDALNSPITANKETVDKTVGDVIALELAAKYNVFKGTSLGLQYRLGHSFKDKVSGSKGFNYSTLEENTDWTEQIIEATIGYSTIPLYLEKKFPIPLNTSVTYRDRFKGDNDLLKSKYVELTLQLLF